MAPTQGNSTVRTPSPALSPTLTLSDGSAHLPIRYRSTFARFISAMDGTQQRYDARKDQDATRRTESKALNFSPGPGISYDDIEVQVLSDLAATNEAITSYDTDAGEDATMEPLSAVSSLHQEPLTPGQQSVSSFQENLRSPHMSSLSAAHLLRSEENSAETPRSTYEGSVQIRSETFDLRSFRFFAK